MKKYSCHYRRAGMAERAEPACRSDHVPHPTHPLWEMTTSCRSSGPTHQLCTMHLGPAWHLRVASIMKRGHPTSSTSRGERSEGQRCLHANNGRETCSTGTQGRIPAHTQPLPLSKIDRWWEMAASLIWGLVSKCTAWVLLPVPLVIEVVDWRLFLLFLLSASSKMLTNFSVWKVNKVQIPYVKNPSRNTRCGRRRIKWLASVKEGEITHPRTSAS